MNNNLAIGINYKCNHHKNSRSIHAEVAAVQSYSPDAKEMRRGVCLASLRFTKDGILRNAKPCRYCVRYMKKVSKARGYVISFVIYSTDEGLVKISLKELVRSIKCCYISSGTKN